jgi:hypothetical protein
MSILKVHPLLLSFFYSKYKTLIFISKNRQAFRPTFLRPPYLNIHSYKTTENSNSYMYVEDGKYVFIPLQEQPCMKVDFSF